MRWDKTLPPQPAPISLLRPEGRPRARRGVLGRRNRRPGKGGPPQPTVQALAAHRAPHAPTLKPRNGVGRVQLPPTPLKNRCEELLEQSKSHGHRARITTWMGWAPMRDTACSLSTMRTRLNLRTLKN